MNLVRLGHYHTPTGAEDAGYCQTALVVKVWDKDSLNERVNIVVWDSFGSERVHSSVAVSEPLPAEATFHLSGNCPWER